MIIPVNKHIVIEPLRHESFISSSKETYEEIGIVVALESGITYYPSLKVGDRVFFDSWCAAKYPKNENEFYWLVKYDDVRGIEHE